MPYIIEGTSVQPFLQELFAFDALLNGMRQFLPPSLYDYLLTTKDQITTIEGFQTRIILPILNAIEADSITALTTTGLDQLSADAQYLFISNHRDIILDSAYLNTALHHQGFRTSQIAIGDNLMRHRISELIFRLNKSFVVKRSGSPMELYRSSVTLSDYIHQTIGSGRDSVWLAQREGRAKDGNDRTQAGVLKMLSLAAGKSDLVPYFKSFNIVPVSISYEFNPCGLLKTQEYLAKLDDPEYKKAFDEDLKHILLGLKGSKGRVHFHFGQPLDAQLDVLTDAPNAKRQLEILAECIDHQIHQGYRLNPVNYVAHDLLTDTQQWAGHYTPAEFESMRQFFQSQLDAIPAHRLSEGRAYLLGMYANPLLNQQSGL